VDDRLAHARDAGGVDIAHLLERRDRMQRLDLELAALVADERPVAVPQHANAVELVEVVGDLPRVLGIADLDRDLAQRQLPPNAQRHDVPDQATMIGDLLCDSGELPGTVRDLQAEGDVQGHARERTGSVRRPQNTLREVTDKTPTPRPPRRSDVVRVGELCTRGAGLSPPWSQQFHAR
jgi:hypothetical protein